MSNSDNNIVSIKLELALEEVNLVLKALGEQPFKDVYGLVDKIQQQAGTQLTTQTESNRG